VTAALGEDIPLRDVLAQEHIDEAAWPAADRAWKEALVGSVDLHLRYLRLVRQAEDCLSRRLEPLDEDPAAWTGLLDALALSDEPDRVLESLGLRMTDVGRLGRAWRGKAEKDPAVADRLAALAGKAKSPRAVRCGPVVLRPFPWTPPAQSRAAPAVDAPPAQGSRDLPADAGPPEKASAPSPLPSYLAALLDAPARRIGAASPPRDEPPIALQPPLPVPPPDATLDLTSAPHGPAALPFAAGPALPTEPSRPAAPRVDTGTIDAPAGAKRRDPSAGPVISGLTITQYASLSAELSVHPERASTILPKYGLADDEARRKLVDAWNEVLLRDAALRAQWMQLMAEFRSWLAQQKKSAGG
jgi:hypothetical protein